MDFKGVIKKVLPANSGVSKKGNRWVSQDFVIEEVGNRYNQSIVFNIFGQDNIDRFQLAEGLMVTVQLDFRANEWNEKFYNGVTCYNVTHEGADAGHPSQGVTEKGQQTPQQSVPTRQGQSDDDDLPFN